MTDNSIEEVLCNQCGIEFWAPTRLMSERRKDQREFFCPNGHTLMFSKPSKEDVESRLHKEIAQLEKKLVEQEKLIPNKIVPIKKPLKGYWDKESQ